MADHIFRSGRVFFNFGDSSGPSTIDGVVISSNLVHELIDKKVVCEYSDGELTFRTPEIAAKRELEAIVCKVLRCQVTCPSILKNRKIIFYCPDENGDEKVIAGEFSSTGLFVFADIDNGEVQNNFASFVFVNNIKKIEIDLSDIPD